MRVWIVALLVAITFAGCLDEQAPEDPMDPVVPESRFTDPDQPIPEESENHDHRDPLQHLFARNATLLDSDNLRRFDPLWSEEQIVGAHVVDVYEDIIAVGVFGDHDVTGQQGFHLFRTDNGTLEHLSFWDAGEGVGGDRTLAISGDGQTVFLGFEGGGNPGVAAIDISDPGNLSAVPEHVWIDPEGFGSHTVAAGTIDGTQYVFSLALGVNTLRYDEDGFTWVGKYMTNDEASLADSLSHVDSENPTNTYFATYGLRAVYGHDMNFYLDPETGTPLLLVAYAYDGAKILDISQPSAPVMLGRFLPPEDTSHRHYTHSITAERIDGRLVIVVGSETFESENQPLPSPIWILDGTDLLEGTPNPLARAEHLGTWTNPGQTAAGHLGISVHFFRQEEGLLYISHYHGGVWAVDISTPEARRDPQAFGYIMPIPEDAVAPPEECCIGFDLDGAPMVFDVAVKDGYAYAADIIQGVTSIKFERPV